MASPASTSSSRSSSSRAALLAALGLALAAHPAPARACAEPPDVASETTFDPAALGDPAAAGLLYDPYSAGYGEGCDAACERQELTADWAGYLAGVDAAAWSKVLFEADLPTLDGLIFFLKGKQPAPPPGWERSPLAAVAGGQRERVVRALYLVGFARRVEPFAAFDALAEPSELWARRSGRAAEADALARGGERSLSAARDPFLRQRYAFLLLRLRFYRQDWAGAVAFHRAHAAELEAPSQTLRWRARYYLAGAHWRLKRYAEANLELARVAAHAPGLAGHALRDFHPLEDADWQATLALARSPQERAWLWAVVGITRDGTAAMAQIAKLDPGSRWLPLLAVREVARLEDRPADLATLERLCADLAGRKGADRPWVLEAVAGHAAALRGDLSAARPRLARAVERAPSENAALRTQARASLALALAGAWRPGEAKLGEELAQVIPNGEGQIGTAWRAARARLSKTCEAAGLREEAELFTPTWGPGKAAWKELPFVERLLKRARTPETLFERFMVEGSGYTPATLQAELARLHLVQGDLPAASQALPPAPGLPLLGTDPFVMHVVDCHDCDQARYARAPWTLGSYLARLAALEQVAGGEGEPAARAAYELGSGLYNLTWNGNARTAFEASHLERPDTAVAERWFRRAYQLTADRELKARAATMAAKCELARREEEAGAPPEASPVSATWYPALAELSGTAYEQEVLKECGWYRDWKQQAARRR